MSQTYFSKLDPKEMESRLIQLATSKGLLTIWVKGSKTKHKLQVYAFERSRNEIILDSSDDLYSLGESILCSFDLRGMSFFCEVIFNKSLGRSILQIKKDVYKSEKRGSYRLLTFPIYEVYAEFDLGEAYEGGKVVDFKSRTSQTALFKSFLHLVNELNQKNQHQKVKYRVQDLSATGMSLQIGEIDSQIFSKDFVFKEVTLHFKDGTILVPEVKVVYVVNYIAGDKNLKKYKVGLHFPNLPSKIDEQIASRINKLLREIDSNKDFENFTR